MSFSAVVLSNNILNRAFSQGVNISPMKLQKLLYFVTSEYGKRTGEPLLTETFQPWKYGPVVRSVYDEFKPFAGGPIRAYGKDALNQAYIAVETSDADLAGALTDVWNAARGRSAVDLSRITHLPGSAWEKSYESGIMTTADIISDQTYVGELGLRAR